MEEAQSVSIDAVAKPHCGRMEAVGLASLSLSKTGTLTTKTTLAIGTTSVTIATSASRKANALVWDSQPN